MMIGKGTFACNDNNNTQCVREGDYGASHTPKDINMCARSGVKNDVHTKMAWLDLDKIDDNHLGILLQ